MMKPTTMSSQSDYVRMRLQPKNETEDDFISDNRNEYKSVEIVIAALLSLVVIQTLTNTTLRSTKLPRLPTRTPARTLLSMSTV